MRPGRIRGIKPEYFHDENVAELSLAAAFLFPGLWTIADREGRFRDRPREIQGVLVPLRSDVDVAGVLAELAERGFVHRYEIEGHRYVQVINWKHQHINVREPASDIPPPDPDKIQLVRSNRARARTDEYPLGTRQVPASHVHALPRPVASTPGSESESESESESDLHTEGEREGEQHVHARASTRLAPPSPEFDRFWALYPKRRSKADALKAWRQLKPSADLVETILAAVARWSRSLEWRKDGGQFIPYPASWLRAHGWKDEATVDPTAPDMSAYNAMIVPRKERR